MIPIVIQNGLPFIWNSTDWLKLREEFRIVGNLTGCLVGLPRQDTLQGLPLILLKEEVTLLVEKKIAFVIDGVDLCKIPDNDTKERFQSYKEQNKTEQVTCYDSQRKQQITLMIDRIIEGKRRKLLGLSNKKKKIGCQENPTDASTSEVKGSENLDLELDREDILRKELEKSALNFSPPLLVQTFTSEPWLELSEAQNIDQNFSVTAKERLKYSTFKDLWEKGFYITEGHKFGVDYLVYPGDPVKFHAQFLVVCADYNEEISPLDMISYSRLGSISRKTFVIASQLPNSEHILYQSIQWTEHN